MRIISKRLGYRWQMIADRSCALPIRRASHVAELTVAQPVAMGKALQRKLFNCSLGAIKITANIASEGLECPSAGCLFQHQAFMRSMEEGPTGI